MKRLTLLLLMMVGTMGYTEAQVLLADSSWTATSIEQTIKAEFNGELSTLQENVTINYDGGNLTITNNTDPQKSFTVMVKYDKTELGVVHFEPEGGGYARVTVHLANKIIVVEGIDFSMTSYEYGEIEN